MLHKFQRLNLKTMTFCHYGNIVFFSVGSIDCPLYRLGLNNIFEDFF